MTWRVRRHWTARMLRRHLFAHGGGGLGLRPLLNLRVPRATLPGELPLWPHWDSLQPDTMPFPLPRWLDFDDEPAVQIWRDSYTGDHSVEDWNRHADKKPPTWKFIDFYPAEARWVYVALAATSSRDLRCLEVAARALNAASAAGVCIGVQHRPRYAIARKTEARRIRRQEEAHIRGGFSALLGDREHALALRTLDQLVAARPGTLEGAHYDRLAAHIETYEKQRYPIAPPTSAQQAAFDAEQGRTP